MLRDKPFLEKLEESVRLDVVEICARRIVREGRFAPSVRREETSEGSEYRACWTPVGPMADEEAASFDAVSQRVDALVRDRLPDALREEAFLALRPRYRLPHTPLERWAYGLLSADAPPALPDWLAEDVAEWRSDLERKLSEAPARVGLVLLEPEQDFGRWMLVPGLLSEDGERRFVPARAVWASVERDPVIAGKTWKDAHTQLALAVAEASGVFAPLNRLDPTLPGCPLSEDEALQFLQQTAAQLERLGFRVWTPPWWDAPAPLEASIAYFPLHSANPAEAEQRSGHLSFSALLEFRKELLLGGEPIGEAEWKEAAEGRRPVLFRHGRWYRLRPEQYEAGSQFFRSPVSGAVSAAEALRTIMSIDGGGVDAGKHAANAVRLTAWSGDERLRALVAGLRGAATAAPLPPPDGFAGELRDYQAHGYSWLVRMKDLGFGACLADDMGLGKTVQWIAYALHVSRRTNRPLLLLCPTSLLGNWQRELQRFSPSLRVLVH